LGACGDFVTVMISADMRNCGLGADWREQIGRRWSIHLLGEANSPAAPLWCTRCAPVKGIDRGVPSRLYQSRLISGFFALMERSGRRYGVLSDLYGLHMDDEDLAGYDLHPSRLTAEDKVRLGRVVGTKARLNGFQEVVFYNSSPLRSVPYFEILAASGLSVWYTTRLPAE
jgi:hypothetical protein